VPTILPPFTFEEVLETTKIHSVVGVLDARAGLVGLRPFRAPHHTIIPRPGEVSLAHNGVLFLDELPEFPRNRRDELLSLRISQRPHPRMPLHTAHDPALHF
jgi:magnesium chelatase family protein